MIREIFICAFFILQGCNYLSANTVERFTSFDILKGELANNKLVCVGETLHYMEEQHNFMIDLIHYAKDSHNYKTIFIEYDSYVISIMNALVDSCKTFEHYKRRVDARVNLFSTDLTRELAYLIYYSKMDVIGIDFTHSFYFNDDEFNSFCKELLNNENNPLLLEYFQKLNPLLLDSKRNGLSKKEIISATNLIKSMIAEVKSIETKIFLKCLMTGVKIENDPFYWKIKYESIDNEYNIESYNARDSLMFDCLRMVMDERSRKAILITSFFHQLPDMESLKFKRKFDNELTGRITLGQHLRSYYNDSIFTIGLTIGKIIANRKDSRTPKIYCKRREFGAVIYSTDDVSVITGNKNEGIIFTLKPFYIAKVKGPWFNDIDMIIHFPITHFTDFR